MNLYTKLTYDIWRRLLPRYGNCRQGSVWLECGTGPGYLHALLGKWFPQVKLYGLDLDSQEIQRARQASANARLLVASAESLPFPDQAFDAVLSLHMVEHLPEPEIFFREAARVLRPQGLLVFATPNPDSLGARVMKERWPGWVPDHISLHPPATWQEMLRKHGFTILRHGTTGCTDIPIFRKLPLALLNWGPLFVFGFFPWRHGGAYICLARRQGLPG